MDLQFGPCTPLRESEQDLVRGVFAQLAGSAREDELRDAIAGQASSLELFGELLARYPSPLDEQRLGIRHRGLETLVDALCKVDESGFTLRAPTRAIVGRALNLALINFLRLLWHVCTELPDPAVSARLREDAARRLRAAVYAQLVEDVLSGLVTDALVPEALRRDAVRHLAQLWGRQLALVDFFPILESTWEARSRVRVVGGTLVGTSELFQLLTRGGDARFVELVAHQRHGEDEARAFREFLFDTSSEELERLTARMMADGVTSIEIDSRLADTDRDAGSILYEFFQTRHLQAISRRLAGVPGPRHTAEGYVVLAWLERGEGGRV